MHSYLYGRQLVVVRLFFFFNDTATTEIYTLSLHDALPISRHQDLLKRKVFARKSKLSERVRARIAIMNVKHRRSEEHTSELQSPDHLVCRLLLEKKKKIQMRTLQTNPAVAQPPTIDIAHNN